MWKIALSHGRWLGHFPCCKLEYLTFGIYTCEYVNIKGTSKFGHFTGNDASMWKSGEKYRELWSLSLNRFNVLRVNGEALVRTTRDVISQSSFEDRHLGRWVESTVTKFQLHKDAVSWHEPSVFQRKMTFLYGLHYFRDIVIPGRRSDDVWLWSRCN